MTRILARVGAKGQTVIPKPVRDELGLRPGDEVYFSTHQGHAHLEPAAGPRAWGDAFARVVGLPLPADLDVRRIVEEEIDSDLAHETDDA